jgi:hypothetical protein
MTKEEEIMLFLNENIFLPILDSTNASNNLKQGVRYTIMRLNEKDALGMVKYYWSAISGTERSIEFARHMKEEGFTRFEDIRNEFSKRFDPDGLKS